MVESARVGATAPNRQYLGAVARSGPSKGSVSSDLVGPALWGYSVLCSAFSSSSSLISSLLREAAPLIPTF